MYILFTICGRSGSKGIKNKNIKDFLGLPLPLYTLASIDLYLSRNPDVQGDVVLNTDSHELVEIFQMNNLRKVAVIQREIELCGDRVPKIAVIRNCWEEMEKRKYCKYDMVVDLDITSPLRTVKDIENLIRVKLEKKCDVVFSVTDSRRNPYFNMVKKAEKGYERVIRTEINARQAAPLIYDMNASLYAYSPEFLSTDANLFEGYCEVTHMYDTAILDLDHENDFELMQVIAKYLFSHNPEFAEIQNHAFLSKRMKNS